MPAITLCLFLLFGCCCLACAASMAEPTKAPKAVRFAGNPIITPDMSESLGTNINGPSLIRVPDWVERPLGKYYLYFAHHQGKFIRLAYADRLDGPWKIHEPGVLRLEDVPAIRGHIASPDLLVDEERRELRMYFHGPAGEGRGQLTLLAFSKDGLHFEPRSEYLGPSYFRVFRWDGYYYALSRAGLFQRSRDGIAPFQPGPTLLNEGEIILRHAALKLDGDVLSVYYSRIGDEPERILLSKIHLTPDWMQWQASQPVTILAPELLWEGADLPLRPSKEGWAPQRVRELRDPAIFEEGGHTYLIYSIAGEHGLAIAEVKE